MREYIAQKQCSIYTVCCTGIIVYPILPGNWAVTLYFLLVYNFGFFADYLCYVYSFTYVSTVEKLILFTKYINFTIYREHYIYICVCIYVLVPYLYKLVFPPNELLKIHRKYKSTIFKPQLAGFLVVV